MYCARLVNRRLPAFLFFFHSNSFSFFYMVIEVVGELNFRLDILSSFHVSLELLKSCPRRTEWRDDPKEENQER